MKHGLAFALLGCFSSALAHLGVTAESIGVRFGDATDILRPGAAPAPADTACCYVVAGRNYDTEDAKE